MRDLFQNCYKYPFLQSNNAIVCDLLSVISQSWDVDSDSVNETSASDDEESMKIKWRTCAFDKQKRNIYIYNNVAHVRV